MHYVVEIVAISHLFVCFSKRLGQLLFSIIFSIS